MALVMVVTGVFISAAAGYSYMALLIVASLHTAMLHTLYSLSLAHTNDWLEPAEIIAANAKLMIGYGIGSIIGPFSASLVMQWLGPEGLWLFLGAAALVLAMFVMVRLHGTPSSAEQAIEQEPYAPMPIIETPHYHSELDSRHEPHQLEFDFVNYDYEYEDAGSSDAPAEDQALAESAVDPGERRGRAAIGAAGGHIYPDRAD